MMGVVLWSDVSDRKAVIWCEDQGDLAFMTGADSLLSRDAFFDAGDLVQFDIRTEGSRRCACNPRLVTEQGSPSLPDALRNKVQQSTVKKPDSYNIISLSRARNNATAYA